MFFAWDITIPADTPETSPEEQTLKLTKGVITRMDVKFPPGCHGLVHVRLLRSEFQLVPLSRGEWVTGDAETVPTEGYYELTETPAQLKFVAFNDDDTYDHAVTVRVSIIKQEVAAPWQIIRDFVAILKKMMGL